jgi:transcriptional regulator
MYIPNYSKIENHNLALELIAEYPLGLLISTNEDGEIESNYYPFFVEDQGGRQFLVTHMARSNPHWKALSSKVSVCFLGPNHYISPSLYVNPLNVSTWNYCAVQVHGLLIEENRSAEEILLKTAEYFERRNGTHWSYNLPIEFKAKLESAIVPIKIQIDNIESKFKLSQNRNSEDYESVMERLKTNPSSSVQAMVCWMEKTRK